MRLERNKAQSLLEALQGCPVAVLGDVMLDEYLFGDVSRISPEAPVPIVRINRERAVLGGAANVAANLKAIGAEPMLIGTVCDDGAGRRLLDILAHQHIQSIGLLQDKSRPTIIKTRVIGQQQQMLRIDREEVQAPPSSILEQLCQTLTHVLEEARALIISDYAKGLIGPALMAQVRQACDRKGIAWIVDPKPAHRHYYEGATLMTPNTKELAALAQMPAKTDEEVAEAGKHLMHTLGLGGLLVTRSEKGMALLEPTAGHQSPWWIPTEAREVYDVSGAGDTVIAVFSAAVASGADWKEAAMLANAAAGVVVGKMGTATASPKEILQHYQAQEAL